jgi:hypothetical protein
MTDPRAQTSTELPAGRKPAPKTIMRRRQRAQQIRNGLFDYQRTGVSHFRAHPATLNAVADTVALAHLDGWHAEDIARAVGRGLAGRMT